ncbi:hypothetical protein BU17DRAFT_64863 [Hysterangium stoloniferum]|nr:hypothetical protein BU17DRAFT_64863 [Hysterangium stoloniferum]
MVNDEREALSYSSEDTHAKPRDGERERERDKPKTPIDRVGGSWFCRRLCDGRCGLENMVGETGGEGGFIDGKKTRGKTLSLSPEKEKETNRKHLRKAQGRRKRKRQGADATRQEGRDVIHAPYPSRRYNSPSLLRHPDWLRQLEVARHRSVTIGYPADLNLILHFYLSFCCHKLFSTLSGCEGTTQTSLLISLEKVPCGPQLQSDAGSLNNTTSRRRVSVTVKNGGANAVEEIKSREKTLSLMAVPISSTIKEPMNNLSVTVEVENKIDERPDMVNGAIFSVYISVK